MDARQKEEHINMLAEHMRFDAQRQKFMEPLMSQGMPFIQALIVAGDMVSAVRASELVAKGMSPQRAVNLVGSYSRFEWAIANLPRADLLKRLPDLWRGSDPDDSDPRYLALWREAYAANGNKTVLDSKETLPEVVKVYRGQVGKAKGLSWTTDIEVAKKFAATGGTRTRVRGGKVLIRTIWGGQALAYLTKRSESEVILDTCE